MTDPVSGQMANQAAQSVAGQQEQVGGADKTDPSSDFSEAMAQGEDVADADAAPGVDEAMEVGPTDQVDRVENVAEIPTDDFVQKLLSEESSIQGMMENCLDGGDMGQEDMLQMQAVIYSYSQRVDLTTKVVENATSGVKQVMNTQV